MSNTSISRRSFLKIGGGTAASLTILNRSSWSAMPGNPGVTKSMTYPETKAELHIKDPSRFKIMQLTDSHFFRVAKPGDADYLIKAGVTDRDARTMEDWHKLIETYQPDLIAHTGDMWHDNPDGRGAEFQKATIERLDSLGLPWVCIWGNHDQLDDVPNGHDRFHDGKHSLYRGGPGGGNYTLDILGPDGKPVWEIFCLNTQRLGLVNESLDWLKNAADEREKGPGATPAFVLHHIPTHAYVDAVTNKTAAGFFLEPVSHENETGAAFEQIKRLKTVKACFCGHDHVSDISGIVNDIELIFGRSSGWNGYGAEDVRKGGKLTTVNCQAGTYAWESVFPDGLRWHPDPRQKIVKALDEPFMQDPFEKKVNAAQ